MTDAEANALQGADPAHASHPVWAAHQLARMLADEDGFDRLKIASAFLIVAKSIARQEGAEIAFATVMHQDAITMALTAGMVEN